MTPELSIIIPVYNVKQWLPACMASILSQTFTNWELLLIDDGSTDGSGELCDDYAFKDKRVTVIHKANAGVSAARNDGMDIAKGEFLTFVDSDDELGTASTLEENIKILKENPQVDIVQFPWSKVKDGRIIKSYNISNCQILKTEDEMLASMGNFELTYQIWQKIYRKPIIDGTRFTDMKIGEDGWFLMDILPEIQGIYLSHSGMYRYNVRETSAMRTMDATKKFDEFKMNYRLFLKLCNTDIATENSKAKLFYAVIEHICTAKALGINYDFHSEIEKMKAYTPHLNQIFHHLKKSYKKYLLQTKLYGLDYTVNKWTNQLRKQFSVSQ